MDIVFGIAMLAAAGYLGYQAGLQKAKNQQGGVRPHRGPRARSQSAISDPNNRFHWPGSVVAGRPNRIPRRQTVLFNRICPRTFWRLLSSFAWSAGRFPFDPRNKP